MKSESEVGKTSHGVVREKPAARVTTLSQFQYGVAEVCFSANAVPDRKRAQSSPSQITLPRSKSSIVFVYLSTVVSIAASSAEPPLYTHHF